MKKIFKALSSLVAAVLLVSACNVEHPMPTYSPENSQEVSFVQATLVNQEILATASTFDITLSRNTPKEAATVAVTSTFASGVVCPATVTFNAGESTATLSLDITGMEVGVSYKGTVSLSDTTTFNKHIAVASATLTLAKAYTWVSLGEGEWFDNLALMSSDSYGIQKVEVLKADGFNRYRIMNPYANKEQLAAAWGESSLGGAKNTFIEFWVLENGTNVAWDGWWCPGILYDGAGTDIKAYYPSYLSASVAADDAKSRYYDEKVIGFYPYWYIDGLGGFGTKYPCFLSLPGGPALESWL
ncbi:MAG: hypothetical protein IKW65_00680 [Bacteroidales bacterium]|nr:hypothetical protein [Bacteroidales bacterium]